LGYGEKLENRRIIAHKRELENIEKIKALRSQDLSYEKDFVKALIASESGFDPKILANKKNKNSARGLMQITNQTRKILAVAEFKGARTVTKARDSVLMKRFSEKLEDLKKRQKS